MCPSISIFWGQKAWKSLEVDLSFDYTKFDTNAMKNAGCYHVVTTRLKNMCFFNFIFHLRWKAQALPHVSRARSATQKSSKKNTVSKSQVQCRQQLCDAGHCNQQRSGLSNLAPAPQRSSIIQDTLVKGTNRTRRVGIFQEHKFVAHP